MASAVGGGSPAVVAPPQPKSPPKYPDFSGRRRLQLDVQILSRETGFLEEELQSLEGLQSVSRCCKEVNEFVATHPDPLLPVNKKRHNPCCIFKWLRKRLCHCLSWICCCGGCSVCSCPKNCCRCNLGCHRPSCCSLPASCCRCIFDFICCKQCCSSCRRKDSCCRRKDSCCLKTCCCCWPWCPKSSCCTCNPRCSKCCGLCTCCIPLCCNPSNISCPEVSCGCVWSCPECTGACHCSKCSRPCCMSGCLC